MSYDYFYGQSGELFSYFRIPKALFQDHRFRQLSTDARTLYGILLDRMSLSVKNGWLDEQGRVYIIYTVREVQESLCCAEHKAVKLFRELEGIDLIERKRRGLGRPSLMVNATLVIGRTLLLFRQVADSQSEYILTVPLWQLVIIRTAVTMLMAGKTLSLFQQECIILLACALMVQSWQLEAMMRGNVMLVNGEEAMEAMKDAFSSICAKI